MILLRFYHPGGLSVAGNQLFVADTNNHKIRVVNLTTKATKTLSLGDLGPPQLSPRPPSFPNAKQITVASADAAPVSRSSSRFRFLCPRASNSTRRSP